jgi:hypothetical protein
MNDFVEALATSISPQNAHRRPKKLQRRLNQFDARSPQMGPRRYAASRELSLKGIGLQRRYPIWGLRACPQNHTMLRCHLAVRQRMPKSFNLSVSFSHEATGECGRMLCTANG